MKARFFSNADEMLDRAEPFLLSREAENNLLLGIAARMRKSGEEANLLCVVEDGGEVVMAAAQAKKWSMVVSRGSEGAIQLLVEEILAKPQAAEVPGVTGPAKTAGAFAKLWAKGTGARVRQHTWLRIYDTRAVIAPTNVAGALSPATRDDLDLIVEWMIEFSKVVDGPHPMRREDVEERLNVGHFFLWRDGGEVVSIAGWAGPTPNGVRINSVYTPPQFRNRGYASASVAALTQHLLESGRKLVFLFTDLKNPTSNSIYQKVGYRAVCDFDDYRFG
ncbi:MAG TPA: GNAT family N-acetyltransferase [Tepidisphaeraceae bacterium]|jgi:predicted GNAT family acetyltransferase|nr:GNAT family N-acetyltransferase [Tepidisphaeraceae bacterium]